MIKTARALTSTKLMNLPSGFFLENTYQKYIQPTFSQLMQRVGKIETCDFQNNKGQVIKQINQWIADNTNNLITSVLTDQDIDNTTKLVLVNAIYFKADWKSKFTIPSSKSPKHFIQLKGSTTNPPMMYQKSRFPYYEDEKVQIISLPYTNENFTMDIFLPIGHGTQNLEDMLQNYQQYDLEDQLCIKEVKVYLPEFKQRSKMTLVPFFQSLGIRRLFDQQLSQMENLVTLPPNSMNHLYVSDVIHEAVIIVDKDGTEAAGATTVTMNSRCLSPLKPF
ncbi:unnamed protein product, partial [marine sediment metagenome]